EIGAAYGRQRRDRSRYHSHENEGEKNLVDVASLRKKEKARGTPEHSVASHPIEVMTPPAPGFCAGRGRAQVCSAPGVAADCDQTNHHEPTYKQGVGNLPPRYRNQDERIEDRGKKSGRELFV